MTLNIETLKDKVQQGCFFTADTALIEYLLGRDLNPFEYYALLITAGEVYYFCPEKIEIEDVIVIEHSSDSSEGDRTKPDIILFGLGRIPVQQPVQMCLKIEKAVFYHYFCSLGKKVADNSKEIEELIQIKSLEQIENIRECVYLNKCAYEDFGTQFKLGMSELDGQRIIEESYYKNTKESVSNIKDIVSGKRTCKVSGFPTEDKPKKGDTIILDLLPRKSGIYCDTTRTFFMGEPGEHQKHIYYILKEAMKECESILRPGTRGSEIHNTMVQYFKGHGLDHNFLHHAGHSFGYSIFEAPYFIKEEDTELKQGMTVALEPGLYLEDEFGIRIENNYIITETGFEKIGDIPLDIEHFIIQCG